MDLLHQPAARLPRAVRDRHDDAHPLPSTRALDRLPRSRPPHRGRLCACCWLRCGEDRTTRGDRARSSGCCSPGCSSPACSSSSRPAPRSRCCPSDCSTTPIFSVSVTASVLIGAVLFGALIYVPLFVQGVVGGSATNSGVVLIPLSLGWVVTSIISGLVISRTGRYRLFPSRQRRRRDGFWLLTRMTVHTSSVNSGRLPARDRLRHGPDGPGLRPRRAKRRRAAATWASR